MIFNDLNREEVNNDINNAKKHVDEKQEVNNKKNYNDKKLVDEKQEKFDKRKVIECVAFVPATPNSKLRTHYKERMMNCQRCSGFHRSSL